MDTHSNKLTITLTDRRPVSIDRDDWPIVAKAKCHDGEVECQANRTWSLIVRNIGKEILWGNQTIVYGVYTTQFQGESDRRGGEIVSEYDLPAGLEYEAAIVAAIHRVGSHIGATDILVDQCIADLPAVDL
mgnify:CR=1 FL=1